MNKTLQDRLVKELRLRGISNMDDGNAFLPKFMADYNRRFARAPQSAHDAHRPLQAGEDLVQTFSWQGERTMSRKLTVHFKRVTYLIEPGPETLPLGGKPVQVREWEDGRVEIQCAGRALPYLIFDQNPHVAAGAIVGNKRLGAALAVIQAAQEGRDQVRSGSKKLTLRQKDRIRAAVRPAERQLCPAALVRELSPPSSNSSRRTRRNEQRPRISARPASRRKGSGPVKPDISTCRNPDIST